MKRILNIKCLRSGLTHPIPPQVCATPRQNYPVFDRLDQHRGCLQIHTTAATYKPKRKERTSKNKANSAIADYYTDVIDIAQIRRYMENEINQQKLKYQTISVKCSTNMLTQVFVLVGVENLAVTDIVDIETHPNGTITLDCSLYPKHLQSVIDAISNNTPFVAIKQSSTSIKLNKPKVSEELRKQLKKKIREQGNATIEEIRQHRNDADSSLRAANLDLKTSKTLASVVHELFLQHQAISKDLIKSKERDLEKDFM